MRLALVSNSSKLAIHSIDNGAETMVRRSIVISAPVGGLRIVPVWQRVHEAGLSVCAWRASGAPRDGQESLTIEVVAASILDIRNAVGAIDDSFRGMKATICTGEGSTCRHGCHL
jgi:hypothetical protein